MLPLILLTVCAINQPAEAETSVYVFGTDQSTVVKTCGFAGVHETYAITGQFQLTVDSDVGIASFEMVDANLADDTGTEYGRSLEDIFNMTGLDGAVIDDTTIEFKGKTADGTESDVRLMLSFMDGLARLTGNTTPPPNSADMFFYDVNAVAIKKYSRGTGEPNEPYQIAAAEDLMLLGESPQDYNKHFILTADIDLDPNLRGRKVFDKAVIAPDINDVELEFQGIPYAGIFDGNGHTVSHLTIQGLYYLGLFGQLDSGANVRNLGVVDVNIVGSGTYAGGLVGQNSGEISVSYSTGVINGGRSVGGLVGYNGRNGDINNCSSNCMVSGFENIGGLLGHNYSGRVTRCFSTGLVTGFEDVGGLVGDNDANVTDSFWDMETSTLAYSDGGIGKTTAEMQTANTFLETGWDFVVETENGTEDTWWILEGQGYPRLWWEIPAKYAGGTGEPNDPYLIYTAEQLNAIGAELIDWDKHFKLMADIDLSEYAGTDFNIIGLDYISPFAGVFDGNGHVVKNFSFTDPSRRIVGVFGLIGSTSEIKNIQLVDANVEGRTYVGLLVGYSTGTVSNCSATGNVRAGQYTGGLIGINMRGALTQHCRAVANVSGTSTTGGLVGANSSSTIINCSSDGLVSGSSTTGGITGRQDNGTVLNSFSTCIVSGTGYMIGGLVGRNNYSLVSGCFAAGEVDGGEMVGGLVGFSDSEIANCYSFAKVIGSEHIGGLLGYNIYGYVSHSYSTGEVTGNTNVGAFLGYNYGTCFYTGCFWNTDIQPSLPGISNATEPGLIGATTKQMKRKKTFITNGWDFFGEKENGKEDIWWIPKGNYPRLWWELSE